MTQLQSDIWEGKRPYSVSSNDTIGMKTASKLRCGAETTFSPDQKGSQVVANSRKLNLRRDLRWVANGLASCLSSTPKSQKGHFNNECTGHFSIFMFLFLYIVRWKKLFWIDVLRQKAKTSKTMQIIF